MDCNDYEEIRALMCEYAEYVDDADFERLGELLDGAVFGSAGSLHEADARFIHDWYAATNVVHADGTLRTCHVCSNIAIRPEGDDSARASSYFVVLQCTDALPLQPIVSGRYRDRFAKRDGRWRFTQREVNVRLIGDMSNHLQHIDLRAGAVDRDAVLRRAAKARAQGRTARVS
ncbi:MAG: nuclear transport factor 2 family protein [Myxococcota bacterium]